MRQFAFASARPRQVLIQHEPLSNVLEAYEAFDTRRPGWVKVELQPAG